MPVLSIHSHVVYGHVGNDAAAFGLRRLGVEAWQIDTVRLSNHPGHGACTGGATEAGEIAALTDGLADLGVLDGCDAVLAGYLGTAAQAEPIAAAVQRVRAARPGALAVVDPIMGDPGPGRYVADTVADAVAERLVPRADLVTPNGFELGELTGLPVGSRAEALTAARALLACGPRMVLATSLPTDGDSVEMLAATADAAWAVRVPHLRFAVAPNGAGDLLAGLVTGWLVRGAALADALLAAADAVHEVLLATRDAGRRELTLVQAQDALAAPRRNAERIVLDKG
ncbi:pyridoxine kinase [Limimonas halophila]|uniref:pyridoxal kinase n=1 Tax=Limimonas halophila TaxID=1082479 RepID=A0A1G7RGC7_9PROT|nr:pyridoxal kinase PdxY [Limimonas halophila]SDG09801.1 pyridoxine kinase [Limimonas halophila]